MDNTNEWESLSIKGGAGFMFRLKVPGGWLVKEVYNLAMPVAETWDHKNGAIGWENKDGYQWTSSICFYPDPEYIWFTSEPGYSQNPEAPL